MSSKVIFRFWPPVASEVGYEVVWFPEFEVAEQLWSSAKTKKCFLPRIASASKSNFWPRVASEVEYAVDSRLLINFGIQLQPQKCILWWIDQCFGLWWPLVASEVGTEFILFVENDLKMLSLSFPIFNFWPPVTSEVVEQFWKSAISIPPEFWHENWNGTFRDICKHCVAKAFHHLSFSEQI